MRDGKGGPVLVTGGAGFIGCNVASRLLKHGERVRVLDNLSRPGVERNASWLRELYGDRVEIVVGDVRDAAAVRSAARDASFVFHLAAQVAVTTSLVDPLDDFDVNARGTLNVLEAIRAQKEPPPLLFTSTNKVYGALDDVVLRRTGTRYEPDDPKIREHGISEERRLEFHSPYGCSKGTADQYVLDFARTFGLKTCVFRMSCIYGARQFGTEDQGWVAHFVLRALAREAITVYGDGKQVRDILYIDDLVDAFLLARKDIAKLAGCAFNVGGGVGSTISLVELVDRIGKMLGDTPALSFEPWRVADQRYYVSDIAELGRRTGWRPRIGIDEGLERLVTWLREVPRLATPRDTEPQLEVLS